MQLDSSIAAVITGGASDLGAATARRLASHGVKIALFDLNAELGVRPAMSLTTFTPAHRINSGPFGTMGAGQPFGIGAMVAKSGSQVVVLTNDGSPGFNVIELGTSVLEVLQSDARMAYVPRRVRRARGGHPPRARAVRRAVDLGGVAVLNVRTDPMARAKPIRFFAQARGHG